MMGLIKTFSLNGSNGQVVLKDPSGEIHGTVHRKALEQYGDDMAPGAGLVLKDVSVFSPSSKRHYMNITPSNIVQMHPAEKLDLLTQASQEPQLSPGLAATKESSPSTRPNECPRFSLSPRDSLDLRPNNPNTPRDSRSSAVGQSLSKSSTRKTPQPSKSDLFFIHVHQVFVIVCYNTTS